MAECLSKTTHDNGSFHCPYDTDDEDDYDDFCDHFTFSHTLACCVCNGYYAPSFGEPMCGTCHAFLFPVTEEKYTTDLSDNDEDSGNDEPPYNLVAPTWPTNRNERDPLANDGPASPIIPDEGAIVLNPREDDRIATKENAFLGDRPSPDPPRNLRQFLNALSEPRIEAGPSVGPANALLLAANARRLENGSGDGACIKKNGQIADIIALPVEVLLSIFSYLDDLSLCNVGEVCKRWRKILEMYTPQAMWEKYTKQRWPLFRPVLGVSNWFNVYNSLMSSCFCQTCLIQMTLKMPRQADNPFRLNRLRDDIRTLDLDGTEGIEAVPLDNQLSHWQASILGPVGSPYEGGKFFLHIIIPPSYPMRPPVVRFLTKIIHPNVSRHGDVGIDIIQHNWSLALTLSKLLLSVQSLLTDPFTEICMEPELGRIYDTERPKFEALAKHWTWKYAMFELYTGGSLPMHLTGGGEMN